MDFASRLTLSLVACAAVLLAGCGGEKPQVKVQAEPPRLVENGTLYEVARADVHGAGKVVLPKDAIVRRTRAQEAVQLFMSKQLQFFGHPPGPINLHSAARVFGLCDSQRR